MTPDKAHERAEDRASKAVETRLAAWDIHRTTATEHLPLDVAQHCITAYLAAMEAAGFVVVPVEADAYAAMLAAARR